MWTGLILPFVLSAPGQLSLKTGVASADGWCIFAIHSTPLSLFDTGTGVHAGTHVRSVTLMVSVFVIEIFIAGPVATLTEWKGNTIGAVNW